MVVKYTLSDNYSKEAHKLCDEGAKAFQALICITTKQLGWRVFIYVWVLSRFYNKIATDTSITYDFYLLGK